jgi:hypothetical protein
VPPFHGMAGARDPAALEALARHAEALATVRAFAERSGAERVVLLVDQGDHEEPAMLDCAPDGTVELTHGDSSWTFPPSAHFPARARPLPDIRPAPASALRADPATGELAAPIGAVANLSESVLGLARAFGGRSVASADFATHDLELPMTIVAREGEPLLLAIGDGRFELPAP